MTSEECSMKVTLFFVQRKIPGSGESVPNKFQPVPESPRSTLFLVSTTKVVDQAAVT